MPAEKEGERGRDQHLDVEILPPRDLRCIRKIKNGRKEHLPSLLKEAVEAQHERVSVVSEAQARATIIHTHTQDLVFISGRDV